MKKEGIRRINYTFVNIIRQAKSGLNQETDEFQIAWSEATSLFDVQRWTFDLPAMP
jgi:hypothetical protein